VAAHAIRQERLDLVVARRALEPLGAGELPIDALGLGELEVGSRRAAAGDIDLLGADQIIARRADRDVVMPGFEPVGREAELPSFLALTRTPSIAPSSAEETWPESAAVCALAPVTIRPANTPATLAYKKALLIRICRLPCDDFADAVVVPLGSG
jgi:hypothetical protein